MKVDNNHTGELGRPLTASDGRQNGARGHGSKSEALRERAILALLLEATISATAKRCGVGERTLRRWMTDDSGFQAELAAARRAVFEGGVQRIQALAPKAVETLEQLLGDKRYPSVRLGAARTVIALAADRHDAEMLLARIQELERFRGNRVRG